MSDRQTPRPITAGPRRVARPAGQAILVWSLAPIAEGRDPDAEKLSALIAARPPGVIPLTGLERDGALHHLVMQDVPGDPLERVLAFRGAEPLEALDLAIGIALGLQALHAQGIVHGRIGPGAVFRGREGVHLALPPDALVPAEEAAQRLELRETAELACLAPEQTGRTDRAVDHRADLYALGALLHLLFAGAPPFVADSRLELVHQHLAVEPPPLTRAPAQIAAIAARLLAKDPDERYQTTFGLLWDLKRCRPELASGATPTPFQLGERDGVSRLAGDGRLYGRNAQLERLNTALDRTREGHGAFVLLSGLSGAGKSALVAGFLDQATEGEAVLALPGKHDQLRQLPYAALQEALGAFVRTLSKKPSYERAEWCRTLTAGLGASAGALAEFLPGLQNLVDLPAPPDFSDAAERDQRLRLTAQALFAHLATPEQPAVLFLDDVQWADSASLALLQDIVEAVDLPYLMVILAFRADEVNDAHPLRRMQRALAARGHGLEEIEVTPLTEADALALVSDSLSLAPGEAGDLAEAVWAKCLGNPFHLRQILTALHDEGAIRVDPSDGSWQWRIEDIRGRVVDADIARLMAERVDRLSVSTRETLRIAACFGIEFALDDLALLDSRSTEARRAGLEEARAAGLIRLATDSGAGDERYVFGHDRVQEAAYSQIPGSARMAAHLRLGTGLLDRVEDPLQDTRLFDALHHFGRASGAIRDAALGRRITEAALIAARRTKRVAAYDTSLSYLRLVTALPDAVSGAGWAQAPDLAAALTRERVELEFLLGSWDDARPSFETLMQRLTDPRKRAAVHELLVTLFTFRADYTHAIEHGVAGLKLLGVNLSPPYGPKIGTGLLGAQMRLIGKPRDDFSHLDRMDDPAREQIMQMLLIVSTPAFLENKDLFVLVSLRMFALTQRYGLTHAGAASIGYYGLVNYIAFGAVDRVLRIMKNLFELFEKFGSSDQVRGRLNYTYCMIVGWYRDPYARLLTRLEENAAHSWAAADLEYAGYYQFGVLK